jgi:putative tricarboxylic transport membrane protein
MSDGRGTQGADGREQQAAFSQRSAEIGVAALFFILGAIVVVDSYRIGSKWGDDGPQAGYFPFYIGLLVCASALVNFAQTLLNKRIADKGFVERGQLKLVLSVLLPSLIYALLIGGAGPLPGLGIYVASAVFVAFFMRWLGGYAWWKVALVAIGNSVAFYLIFEIWFLVALPKGPLEALLGLA